MKGYLVQDERGELRKGIELRVKGYLVQDQRGELRKGLELQVKGHHLVQDERGELRKGMELRVRGYLVQDERGELVQREAVLLTERHDGVQQEVAETLRLGCRQILHLLQVDAVAGPGENNDNVDDDFFFF